MAEQAIQTPTPNIALINLDELRLVINEMVNSCIEKYIEKNKEDNLFTIAKAAEILGVDKSTLYRWDKEGTLEKVHIGGKVRIRESDIKRILGQRKNKALEQ